MAKYRVEHSCYGCECGCCGHVVLDAAGDHVGGFSFNHPNAEADKRQWAQELMEEKVMGQLRSGAQLTDTMELDFEASDVQDIDCPGC